MNVDRIGRVIASEVNADGWIGVQIEPLGGKAGSAPFAETIHPNGFLSRPVDPDTDDEGNITASTSGLVLTEGGEEFVLPISDARQIKDLVALNKGDAVAYAPGGAVFSKWGADGSLSHFCTTDNTYTGRSVSSAQNGKGWDWSHPSGRMMLGELGFHVALGAGAGISLSAIAAPDPLSALGTSILTLQADFIQIDGKVVSIGSDGGVTNEAVKAAIIGAFDALVLAISKITPTTPGATALADPVVVAAIATFHTAMQDFGKFV